MNVSFAVAEVLKAMSLSSATMSSPATALLSISNPTTGLPAIPSPLVTNRPSSAPTPETVIARESNVLSAVRTTNPSPVML